MWEIPVFSAEKEAGIDGLVKASVNISYASALKRSESETRMNKYLEKVLSTAGKKDFDLHFLDTILATTGWNINKDVFMPDEVWMARKTPDDKPFNFKHQRLDIIGHITNTYAVDENYNLIDDDLSVNEIPSHYHLLTSAVIYRMLDQKERAEMIEKIIAEIDEDKWFVSMEAYQRNFDYALLKGEEQRIVQRNEETAFLTKALKQYGGKGEYQGYSLGRVLRGITFAGKGLVDKPANPDSIIFKDVKTFTPSISVAVYNNDSGGSNNTQELNMAETNNDGKVVELEGKVNALTSANESLTGKVSNLESELTKANDSVGAKEAEITKLNSVVSAKDTEIETLKSRIAELTKASRLSTLVSAGCSEENATKLVESVKALGDVEFAAIVESLKAKIVADVPQSVTKASDETTKTEETDKSSEVIENADPDTTPTLNTASANTDSGQTQLRERIAGFFNLKTEK